MSKKNDIEELTFEQIKSNYLNYRYLTDAEVQWLITQVGGFIDVMRELKKDKHRKTKDGIIRFSMTEELFKELMELL